jgi:hypothetical protein
MSLPSLREIAARLRGEISDGQIVCPGPGHSPRDRSLAVRPSPDAQDGFIVISYAGDDWRTCRDYVRERLGLTTSGRREVSSVTASRDFSRRRENSWRAIWEEARSPLGTLVERYLASRDLELPAEVAGNVIRFHPKCPFGTERLPCMVSLFRSTMTDEPIAIHRTAISSSGEKLDRKMLGPVRGAAIKLDADADVTMGLVIGEGIETCLAARQLGFRPVWALGSVGAISSFPLLSGIDGLTILAETGEPSARAIQACGTRWSEAGREVIIVSPRTGSDINDALQGKAA